MNRAADSGTAALAPCPLCGGRASYAMTMPLDAKTFQPTAHGKIYRCAPCAFGFVHPRPAETGSFYDLPAYYTQGESHMVPMRERAFLTRLRIHLAWRADRGEMLADVIEAQIPRGAQLVDIGCGGGGLLTEMTRRGYRMTGVERDAASLAAKNLNVLEGSAETLPPIAPGSFDGVIFSHVIEHLVDPRQALRSAAQLLKPGGKLFCEVPNNDSMIARQSCLSWEHLDIPRHINFFGEESLRALAASAGFKVERAYFSGYCRYFSESYIATEQRIHDRLAAAGATESTRNSRGRSWRMLAKTAFGPPARKYDSVGIVATRN